jgi:hypothetical protein
MRMISEQNGFSLKGEFFKLWTSILSIIVTIVLLFAFGQRLFGQISNVKFKTLSSQDGLSQMAWNRKWFESI